MRGGGTCIKEHLQCFVFPNSLLKVNHVLLWKEQDILEEKRNLSLSCGSACPCPVSLGKSLTSLHLRLHFNIRHAFVGRSRAFVK